VLPGVFVLAAFALLLPAGALAEEAGSFAPVAPASTEATGEKSGSEKPADLKGRRPKKSWLDFFEAPERKGVPIPFHCIEGYSGGAITPMAYLCNNCNCAKCRKSCFSEHLTPPSVAYSYMDTGNKDLHSISITQSICKRVELGYALNRLSLGSLDDDIKDAGMDTIRKHVYMHNFNVRVNLVHEGEWDQAWLPAITGGVHFKYNQDINTLDSLLNGAMKNIGFDSNYGVDYTLTASKMLQDPWLKRPLILTGGIRLTEASQLGLLGFGNQYHAFFEGSVVYWPVDWLILGYELRMKESPYDKIPGLIGEEDPWQAFSASFLLGKHLTVSLLYGLTGHIANSSNDQTLGLQVKWEF
jgi:hypothetical protein